MQSYGFGPRARLSRLLCFAVLLLAIGAPDPLSADVEVLIAGASRTILARSGDSLTGGGVLRGNLDHVYWFPSGYDNGDFFINHELVTPNGGLSRLHYENGVITDRRDWVRGNHYNCAGSITGRGTILTCEEHPPVGVDSLGYVIEAYPSQPGTWIRRVPMGRFSHETAVEDPVTGDVYLTNDANQGVLFRFIPAYPGYLGRGSLYALKELTNEWVRITDVKHAEENALALGATYHPRPEGMVYDPLNDVFYIAVTGLLGDASAFGYILRYDPRSETMTRWLDGDGVQLANPDNLEIDICGNLIVQEDMYAEHIAQFGPNEVLLVRPDRTILPILRGLDTGGEPSGLTLDYSQLRFWFNWMRGNTSEFIEVSLPAGWNCEVTGVPASPPAPARMSLVASPNPFSTVTWLRGVVAPGQRVRLDIYDARGAHWRSLVDGPIMGGRLEVAWDGMDHRHRRAPRGYYFARLTAGEQSVAAPIVFTR